jgi:hypothetical protein
LKNRHEYDDQREARRFKEGWRLVNEFTNEEARRKSVSERLRELEMFYQFGGKPARPSQTTNKKKCGLDGTA